jgi:hypothetical protein
MSQRKKTRKKKLPAKTSATLSSARAKRKHSDKAKAKNKGDLNLAAQLLYGIDKTSQMALVNPRTKVVERAIGRDEINAEFEIRTSELTAEYRAAKKVIRKVEKWVNAGYFGPVTGCTVGLRVKNEQIVSPLRYVIQIHVPFKIRASQLAQFDPDSPARIEKDRYYCIPESVDGILIKVVESRPYLASRSRGALMDLSVPNSGLVKVKGDPELRDLSSDPSIDLSTTELIGGLPTVEADKNDWGTMGIAFCNRIDETSASARFFGLANAHFAPSNKQMVQPPCKPTPSNDELWKIGAVAKRKEGKVGAFHVDAALVRLNGNRDAISNLVYTFGQEKFLFATSPLRHLDQEHDNRRDLGRKVFKFGARTRQQLDGFIDDPEFQRLTIGKRRFGTVIRARRNGSGTFVLPGDSGSALVAPIYDLKTKNERFLVVGLCFAGLDGDKEVLYACNFSHVIAALEPKIPKTFLRDHWAYARP